MKRFAIAFNEVVQQFPQHTALCSDGIERLSYTALHARASEFADELKQQGIAQGMLVAISIPKSIDYVVALLGITMSGAVFMPLDPNLPAERRKHILEESNPSAIITPGMKIALRHTKINLPENTAYVFYTSGSTGKPKGVIVPHDGIVNFLRAQIECFGFASQSRSLFYLSTNFDASISDIGVALLSGAALHIESADRLTAAAQLPAILKERGITHIDIPPSLLTILDIDAIPSSLTTIIIGGEICPPDTVRKWATKYRVINVYGPTEATVCSSMKLCDMSWDQPNIGKPIDGISYSIKDEFGHDMVEQMPGELWISGIGLAHGYIDNTALTNEKFVTHGGNRFYRTGDRVQRQANGDYIFLGRIDRQLKIRGQLVAPEEIEAAIELHPDVAQAGVMAITQQSKTSLFAYVECKHALTLSENLLRLFLQNHLPEWMLPSRIIFMDRLPTTPNHKIDYAALPEADSLLQKPSAQPCISPTEKQLQHIWMDILQLPTDPNTTDDFFDDLGGDSLDALRMTIACEKEGLFFPTGFIQHLRTIYDLASWLNRYSARTASDSIAATVLKRDAALDHSIFASLQEASAQPLSSSSSCFVTGATGFLGIHLLQRLLQESDRKIVCLVRAPDAASGYKRLRSAAHPFGLLLPQIEQRVQIVCGDLALPQFGLEDTVWKHLAEEIGHIYHCGAVVNMVADYETLKPANLSAIQEVVRMALSGPRKTIHSASTLSVFVASDNPAGVHMEDGSFKNASRLYGGYAQSKWAAEYLLSQIPEHLLPIHIYRFGLITGDSQSGITSAHDFLSMFVRGLIGLGSLPEGNWDAMTLDATPIDYAAAAFQAISEQPSTRYYHIANQGGFTLRMIVEALNRVGITLIALPAAQWQKACIKRTLSSEEAAAYMALCRLLPTHGFERYRTMDLFQATDTVFDQTQHALMVAPIQCPQPDAALLERYINRILHG